MYGQYKRKVKLQKIEAQVKNQNQNTMSCS